MQKKVWLLLICLVSIHFTVAQNHYIKTKNLQQLRKFFTRTPDRLPLVSAHRGGDTEGFPENCIETFAHTLQYTHAIIECDIALSKDSVLVMMHDYTLNRTTTGSGKVSDYTWLELQKLQLKDPSGKITPYKIPTLGQVLDWARAKTILTLDIKRGVPAKMIVEAVKKHRAESYALIISYNLKAALEYFQLAPNLMQSVNITKPLDYQDFSQSSIPFSQVIAFIGVGSFDSLTVNKLQAKNVYCMLGTMGKLDQQALADKGQTYSQIIDNQVDMLATDNPILARQALARYWQSLKSRKKRFFKIVK
jgi:glycerophosphoryl diester phosphodiesterase